MQALDWEALKSFSRPGICGQKAAEQSWAAVGAELRDGHCNNNSQPVRGAGTGTGTGEDSSSTEEAEKRPENFSVRAARQPCLHLSSVRGEVWQLREELFGNVQNEAP